MKIDKQLVKQMKLEQEAWNTSLKKYEDYLSRMIENGTLGDSKEAILIIKVTVDTLSKHIKEFFELPLRGNNKKCQLFLKEVFERPDDVAYVLIKTLLSVLIREDLTVLNASKHIIKQFNVYYNVKELKNRSPKLFAYIEYNYKSKGDNEVKKRKRRVARNVIGEGLDGVLSKFLGSICIDLVDKSGCNLIKVYKERDSTIKVGLSDDTKALFLRSRYFFESMLSSFLPLIYPPKDWTEIAGGGGYYTHKQLSFIKTRAKRDLYSIKRNLDRDRVTLDRLFKVVNNIQKTPYRINTKILNVVNTIIKYNLIDPKSKPTNPILYGEIPFMEQMNAYELIKKSDYGELEEDGRFVKLEDKKRWLRALGEQEDRIKKIESRKLVYKMALDIANKFKEEDKIYFSYTLDFRGRLYPVQPILNPQASDNIKALLEFSEGEALTDEGVYWLKIHGANCYGYDKLIYEERINEIDRKTDEILDISADPIANIDLWASADSPLLYLAFCMSYGEYLRNPKAKIRATVQLDATCSGIQIYSGLLKDREGALAVNVISNGDRVNDIYKDVADKVEEYLATGRFPKKFVYTTKDNEQHTTPTLVEALSLRGKVTRKLTKRNVMTQPYSVTQMGMFNQVYELLNEYEDNNEIFWQGEKWIIAKLLATLNDEAIGEIVKGAKRGQVFIKEVIKEYLKENDDVFWYSPIFNFPVLQRIKRETKQRLRTPLGHLVLYHTTNETHYTKMLNGIAPNYIHSLDSTLLYRTVERCLERGVKSFWLIHDSYGVKPNDVPILNEEVREAYIEIFEDEPLRDWVAQILPRGVDIVDKVMINDLNLKEVRESKYIFS